MSWIRLDSAFLNDPSVQMLSAREFRAAFMGARRGMITPFTPFMKRDDGRVFSREWSKIRAEIFRRDNYTCQYCSVRGGRLECDHIIPVSRGGLTLESNLVTACFTCNRSKRNKTLEEWRAR